MRDTKNCSEFEKNSIEIDSSLKRSDNGILYYEKLTKINNKSHRNVLCGPDNCPPHDGACGPDNCPPNDSVCGPDNCLPW